MWLLMAAPYSSPEQYYGEPNSEYQARCIATALEHVVSAFRGIEDASEQTAKTLGRIASAAEEMSRQSRRK